ncbi:MAG: DNA-3-methyladenine glycosylase 2 family protein [Micropruina sp.]
MSVSAVRIWSPSWPCPVGEVWQHWRRGASDPTYRVDHASRHWRGLRTPLGPVTVVVTPLNTVGEIRAEAWGPGADWVLEKLPTMLGADDDPSGFTPLHPEVVQARRLHPHWRLGRGGLVMEALVPAIIEQKVTGQEAFGGFRRLVHRHGERAPGPGEALHLWVQPSADTIRLIPSWEWLKLSIDPARSRTVLQVARVADALERTLLVDPEVADTRLRSIAGIGVWTSAEVRSRAHGDPDAVSFGDYHLAKDIGWTLTGAEVDDAGLAELLEAYRPHRHRVQALLGMSGAHRPRRGPRMSPRTHLPTS